MNRTRLAFALLVALAIATAIPLGGAAAHDDIHGKSHFKGTRASPTAVMRALAADAHAGQSLPALAATPCQNGFADSYPCNGVDLLAFLPLSEIGGGALASANDVWGWTDPASGREFALLGRNDGTAFVEVTDPLNPVYLGRLPTHTSASSWRDIKVFQDHAFIVSEASGHGMQVFDLTRLLTASPAQAFTDDAQYNEFGNAHNIVINEDSGYAYAVGTGTCSGGLHMINIQNPTAPSFAGCYGGDGYTHDAQCVIYAGPDDRFTGKEICIASNEDTLTIVDVTDKANPLQVAKKGYVGRGYTHQAWFSEDHALIFLDDELDERNLGHNTLTRVWDAAILDAPIVVTEFAGATTAIDHNLYVKGDRVYQANYRAGLTVLEIIRDLNGNYQTIDEIAFFDIYPSSDAARFNGAWSTYPFFNSGTILVSGMEQGLFVLALAPDGGGDEIPVAALTSPTDGEAVSGNVTLVAAASDDGSVVAVTFYDADQVIGTDSDPSDGWSVRWNTKKESPGAHTLSVEAEDDSGQRSDRLASAIEVTIGDSGGGKPGGGGGGPKCNPRKQECPAS